MLLSSDIKLCKCTTPPVDYTTASVGGAISAGPTYITGSSSNEIFFTMDPNALGGASLVQTNKIFFRNNSATDDAKNCSVYIENFLDEIPANAILTFQSDSALDDATYFVRTLGFDNSGNPIQIDVTLNGTTLVSSVSNMRYISRSEVRSVSTGALVTCNGNITVRSSVTTLGIVPFGLRSGTREISILMEAALDSTTTIATTAANPSGTFFSPRTQATALAFFGNLVFTGGPHAQGVWIRQTIPAATLGSDAIDHALLFNCKI